MNIDSEKPVTADFASKPMSSLNSKHDITTLASSTKSLQGQKKKKKKENNSEKNKSGFYLHANILV